jgi:hypothetical protein
MLNKSELLQCSPMCSWICCSQLAKDVPLQGLQPVLVVNFVMYRNNFKVSNKWIIGVVAFWKVHFLNYFDSLCKSMTKKFPFSRWCCRVMKMPVREGLYYIARQKLCDENRKSEMVIMYLYDKSSILFLMSKTSDILFCASKYLLLNCGKFLELYIMLDRTEQKFI